MCSYHLFNDAKFFRFLYLATLCVIAIAENDRNRCWWEQTLSHYYLCAASWQQHSNYSMFFGSGKIPWRLTKWMNYAQMSVNKWKWSEINGDKTVRECCLACNLRAPIAIFLVLHSPLSANHSCETRRGSVWRVNWERQWIFTAMGLLKI